MILFGPRPKNLWLDKTNIHLILRPTHWNHRLHFSGNASFFPRRLPTCRIVLEGCWTGILMNHDHCRWHIVNAMPVINMHASIIVGQKPNYRSKVLLVIPTVFVKRWKIWRNKNTLADLQNLKSNSANLMPESSQLIKANGLSTTRTCKQLRP